MGKRFSVTAALLIGTALVVLLHCAGKLLGGEHVSGARNASEFFAVSVERLAEGPLDSSDVPLPVAEQALAGEQWFSLTSATVSVAGQTDAHRANAAFVRGDLFASLGVQLSSGAVCKDPRGVILSHAFHQRTFAGSPEVIGRTLLASGRSMQPDPVVLRICGVAAPGFRGVRIGRPHDFWIPWDGWRDLLFPASEPESEVARFFPVELYVRATDTHTGLLSSVGLKLQAWRRATGRPKTLA